MNILLSFFYISEPETVKRLSEAGANVLIDSGAYSRYTAFMRGDYTRIEAIDGMEVYADKYAAFISKVKGHVNGYFNLDMIGDENISRRYQSILESKGISPIPVYHNEDPREDDTFGDFVEKYDYIAVPASEKAKQVSTTTFYNRKRLGTFRKSESSFSRSFEHRHD